MSGRSVCSHNTISTTHTPSIRIDMANRRYPKGATDLPARFGAIGDCGSVVSHAAILACRRE